MPARRWRNFRHQLPFKRGASCPRLAKRLDLEGPALQPLPPRRATDYEETIVTVTSKVFYSVPPSPAGAAL